MKVKIRLTFKNITFVSFTLKSPGKLRNARKDKDVWIYTHSLGVLIGKASVNEDGILFIIQSDGEIKLIDLDRTLGWIYSPERYFKDLFPEQIKKACANHNLPLEAYK